VDPDHRADHLIDGKFPVCGYECHFLVP
jgi:hypothetical protein